ncbi:M14 family zinc carboxypeptidase [Candidatus Marinimicrobia bacterium]|nr:M14 family zinc carboxypeptidase [Candidatus Neomarinimicrobiota bacterium]
MKPFVFIFFIINIAFTQSSLSERYTTYSELEEKLNEWDELYGSNSNPFPQISDEGIVYHHEIIGYSGVDNLPIWAVKLSFNANVDEDEPKMLILGQCHAEEIYGLEIAVELIEWFLNPFNSENSIYLQSIFSIMSNSEVWIVPTHNPEGLEVVHGYYDINNIWQQDESFRKNKFDANMNGVFDFVLGIGDDIDGVDLNRNYDLNWVYGDEFNQLDGGCSTNPSYLSNYDYYRGTEPFSESEIKAIRDFTLDNNFLLSIAYHSSRSGCVSEKVIYPWIWEDEKSAPDIDVISELGVEIAQRIPTQDGQGYYYPTNSKSMRGNAHDWIYANTGCIQYLIEVGTSDMQSDNIDIIEDTISRNMQGLLYLLKKGAGTSIQNGPDVYQISGLVKDVNGNPIYAEVKILENHGSILKPRMTDEFGRFRRILKEGLYTLEVSAFGYEAYIATVSPSSSSVTELNIVLNDLPDYNLSFNISNLENLENLNGIIYDQNNEFELDLSSTLELPQGDYEIFLKTDFNLPYFANLSLNDDLILDIDIKNKGVLIFDNFENSSNWINNENFSINDNQLKSQASDFYQYNEFKSIRLNEDLSQLNNVDYVLRVNLKNELEWDNDKLIFRLSSEDSDLFSVLKEISNHNYDWHDIYIPFNVVDERKYLEIVLETDGSVNYRGFNIDNIELFYECIGLKGDIDNSGYLNISDIILIVDNILMSYDSSQIINCLVDMNNDNVINIFDLINVIEKILEN